MVVKFPQKSSSRSELYSVLEPELDALYDLLVQTLGNETASLELLQRILREATKLYRREHYVRYSRLWIFSLCARVIQKRYSRFLTELPSNERTSYPYLSLDEKLVLLMHDRTRFSPEEIAACLRVPVGRVGRLLAYAREKVARWTLAMDFSLDAVPFKGSHLISLLARVEFNRSLPDNPPKKTHCPACARYGELVFRSRQAVASVPSRRFSEIESTVLSTKLLPIFRGPEKLRWSELSWRWKLGAEISLLGVISALVVFVAPWCLAHINTRALFAGRFGNVFQVNSFERKEPDAPSIDAERLLASSGEAEQEIPLQTQEKDEFADMEFPSGDAYESGAAPVPPSRLRAAVFRLIVQSPSPRDLIPEMKKLFADEKVQERESSGRVMPGGVYFDGITNVGAYPEIVAKIKKLGITKSYSNPTEGRNTAAHSPDARARLIVWIQQI